MVPSVRPLLRITFASMSLPPMPHQSHHASPSSVIIQDNPLTILVKDRLLQSDSSHVEWGGGAFHGHQDIWRLGSDCRGNHWKLGNINH